MSVHLSVERDRIQRQVERLEQSLSAANNELVLLSSETDDEDESDADSEDEDGQTAAGLLAQREKIQSEIQNLEDVLGPHSPVCVSEEDDDNVSTSDESELGLSLSVDSCLQMNLVYQQVIQETLNQLETLLTQNQKQQKELVSQMSGPVKEPSRTEQQGSTSYQQPISMYLGRFLKPYFKDKLTGLGPPANQETKEKASRMTGFLDDRALKIKRWESWQKNLLIHSVNRDGLKRLIQPKLSKVDYLSQKLSSVGETEKQQLKQQIDSLERDIDLLRGKTEVELIGDRYEERDWQKISNIDFEGTRTAEDIRCFWQNFLHPSINKSQWSQEEKQQLKEISSTHNERDWESIAQQLGTGRTAFMCLQTFQRFISNNLKKKTWTSDEDTLLRELVDKMRIGNFIPYTQMSYFMEGRDPGQLIYRWNQVLDPNLKRGLWSKEEDELLLQAVSRYGEQHWWKIRLTIPGRTDNACRDRYLDSLKAGIKRGAFDEEERKLLQQLVEKHGVGRWSKIAAEIPNRLDNQCLREWRKLTKPPPPPPPCSGTFTCPLLCVRKNQRAKRQSKAKAGTKRKKAVSSAKRMTKRQLKELKEELSSDEEFVVHMDSDKKKKKKNKVVVVEKIKEVEKGEMEKGEVQRDTVEKSEMEKGEVQRDEVEKGEMEKGEVQRDEVEKGEMEKGEVQRDEVEKGEMEKGEVQRDEVEKGEMEKGEVQRDEVEKGEMEKGEVQTDEVEKGEMEKGEVQGDEVGEGDKEKVEREEEQYTFPPIQEWIPAEKDCFTYLNFRPVALQSSSGTQQEKSVKLTIRGKFGRSVIIGPSPRVLKWGQRHDSSTMMMVSPGQLQAQLRFNYGNSVFTARKQQEGNSNHPSRLTDSELNYKLQVAVTPWIGNLLIPAKKRQTAANALRECGEKVQLSSTPVFLLLLQAMNVDTVGCKEMIEKRKKKMVPLKPCPIKMKDQMTVSGMLQQRRLKKKALQDLDMQDKLVLTQLQALPLPPPPLPQNLPLKKPQNCPGFLLQVPPNTRPEMSPLLLPHAVFLPNPVLQPPRPASVQLIPAPSLTTPPLVPHRPPWGVFSSPSPAASVVRLPQNATSASFCQQAGPPTQILQTVQLPLSSQTVSVGSTTANHLAVPSSQTTSSSPFLTKIEVPSLVPPSEPSTPAPPPPPPTQNVSPACPQVSSSLDLSLAPPPSLPTNQHTASTTLNLPAPFPSDHDYTFNKPYSNIVQLSPAPCLPNSSPNQPELAFSTGVVPGKRARKPTQKIKALQEAAKTVSKRSPSYSPHKKRRLISCKEKGGPPLGLLPAQSMWVMTSGGLVQVALVPNPPVPAPPNNIVNNQPAAPPLYHPAGAPSISTMPVPVPINSQPCILPALPKCPPNPLPPAFVLRPINPAPSPAFCVPRSPPKLFLPYNGIVRADPGVPPPLRKERLQFDHTLMFLEPQAEVCDWLSGRGGVIVPGLGVSLPYLPPFISSLSTLSVLLQAKKSLTKSSLQLLSQHSGPLDQRPTEPDARNTCSPPPSDLPDSTSDPSPAPSVDTDLSPEKEAELVVALRQMVSDRFAGNPAYQLLKARFLSCFTVPAFLATVQPIKEKIGPCPTNEEIEFEEEDVEMEGLERMIERGKRRRASKSLPVCDASGAPASHFSGINSTNTTESDQNRPEQTRSDHRRPDQTTTDQIRPQQTGSDPNRPQQTGSDC